MIMEKLMAKKDMLFFDCGIQGQGILEDKNKY